MSRKARNGRGLGRGTHEPLKSQPGKGTTSDVLKVMKILAESDKSWEEAAKEAVKRASETLHGIKSICIENFEAKVEENKIVKYRTNGRISFLLGD